MTSVQIVERLRVYQEAAGEATFGKDSSAAIANYVDLRFRSFTPPNMPHEVLADEAKVQQPYDERLGILGAKMWDASLEVDVVGSADALDAAASVGGTPGWGLGDLFEVIHGGWRAAAGSTEDAGAASTATSVNVAAGHGARWVHGGAALVDVGGTYEMMGVLDINTDELVPRMALSGAPTDAAVVYNAHTFYLRNPENAKESLGFVLEADDRDYLFWLMGGQCQSLAPQWTINQLFRCTIGLGGVDWKHDDDVASPIGGSALASADETGGSTPIPFVDSRVLFGAAPTSTTPAARALIHPSAIELSLALAYRRVPSPGGVNGVREWQLVPSRPMGTVTFTLPFENSIYLTYLAAKEARTRYYSLIQTGSAATKCVGLEFPGLQIVDVQPATSEPELHGLRVTTKLLQDDAATIASVASTEQNRSPWKWHFA